jgi:NADH:ubiquinone oxidoreductase subunit 3 (subunit A)
VQVQATYVALFAIVAVAFPTAILLLTRYISPNHPSRVKRDIYECGVPTVGESWIKFHVQYYLYALIFVVFDVETVFLYPWAVVSKSLGLFAAIEMGVFIGILIVGLAYAWRKDALRWT